MQPKEPIERQIPGVETILYKPGSDVWPGESPPSDRVATLIDELLTKLDEDKLVYKGQPAAHTRKQLNDLERLGHEPSQRMRLHFFRAKALSDQQRYADAYLTFDKALRIAEEHADVDSQITLYDCLGLMLYGQELQSDALLLYQQALALWQKRAKALGSTAIEPEAHFRERIGATQCAVGQFDDAHASVARALTLSGHIFGASASSYCQRVAAASLWTLGIVLRSQSDIADGSESLLITALERSNETISLYKLVPTFQVNIGRIYLRMAELLLDLSELYLQQEEDAKAYRERQKALRRLRKAEELLQYADDLPSKLLPTLTRLRYEITRLLDAGAVQSMREFEEQLHQVEDAALLIHSPVISAKASTVRGEWCLWLGDNEQAREALFLALADVEPNNMGEATRARRLLRRSNVELQPPRVRPGRGRPRQRP